MDILDKYLKKDDAETAKPSTPSVDTGDDSVLNKYLKTTDEVATPKVAAPVRPPISGVSKEASDEINAQPAQKGGANPRDITLGDVASAPKKAVGELLTGILEDASAGAKTASQEAFKNFSQGNVATAVGNVGMGGLQMAGSVATGPIRKTGEFIDNVTGKPNSTLPVDLTGRITSDKPEESASFGDRAAFLAGSAVPIVPGAKTISKLSPTNKALDIIVDKVTSNGREPQKLVDLVQRMKENPRIGPADESPAVLNMAQKLFTTEGDAAKNYLHSTSSARVATSKDAVNQAFDTAAGLPVNAVNKIKELGAAAKKVGEDQINPAIKGAGAVNITPVINSIDEVLKPGVMSKLTGESTLPFPEVKEKLANIKSMIANEKEQLTNPQELHNFQSLLRKEAEARMSSADGSERQLGYALMQVRNKIVDAIDGAGNKTIDAVPKQFKTGSKDDTGAWFLKGDKPVYANATESSVEKLFGPEAAKEFSNFPKLTGKDANGNPITIWYKPGEQNKAQEAIDNFASPKKTSSKIEDQIEYHVKNGEAYGYSKASIGDYVRSKYGDEAAKKAGFEKPSGYKEALGNFRGEKEVADAFHDAYNGVLTNSKKLENRPEFTKEWFDNLSEHEKKAAVEGIRTKIDTEIGVAKNPSLAGTGLGKSDFNQKKMEIVLGKEETHKLLKELDDERKISNTHNKIIEGSQTEMRRAGEEAIALPQKSDKGGFSKYVIPAMGLAAEAGSTALGGPAGLGGALGVLGSAAGIATAKVAGAAKNSIEMKLAKERNANLARYSLPTEGPSRDELIRELEARIPGPKQSLVRRAASGGARLGSLIAP